MLVGLLAAEANAAGESIAISRSSSSGPTAGRATSTRSTSSPTPRPSIAARSGRSAPTCRACEITELLPRLAQMADKFALVRSLHHERDEHSGGTHRFLTGYPSRRGQPERRGVPGDRLDRRASSSTASAATCRCSSPTPSSTAAGRPISGRPTPRSCPAPTRSLRPATTPTTRSRSTATERRVDNLLDRADGVAHARRRRGAAADARRACRAQLDRTEHAGRASTASSGGPSSCWPAGETREAFDLSREAAARRASATATRTGARAC